MSTQRARERKERRERAQEFALERGWADKNDPVVDALVAFASLARKQEREANCKAVCSSCRDGIKLDGKVHRYDDGLFMETCKAAAILERGREVEGR